MDFDGNDRVAPPAMVRSPIPHIVDPDCIPTGITEGESGDIHGPAGENSSRTPAAAASKPRAVVTIVWAVHRTPPRAAY
jgi:hypothetical protein